MNPAPHETLFRLQRLENGIYEFIFLEGSIATVDAWMAKVVEINRQYNRDDTVRYIADGSNVDMPVACTFLQSKEFVRRNPDRPHTRTLVLHRVNAPQLILLNIFVNWIQNRSRERAHFLPITRRDEGIAWLLRDD